MSVWISVNTTLPVTGSLCLIVWADTVQNTACGASAFLRANTAAVMGEQHLVKENPSRITKLPTGGTRTPEARALHPDCQPIIPLAGSSCRRLRLRWAVLPAARVEHVAGNLAVSQGRPVMGTATAEQQDAVRRQVAAILARMKELGFVAKEKLTVDAARTI